MKKWDYITDSIILKFLYRKKLWVSFNFFKKLITIIVQEAEKLKKIARWLLLWLANNNIVK